MYKPLFLVLLLLTASGCEALKNVFKPKHSGQAPSLLTANTPPTLEQLTSVTNRNSLMIKNMQTDDASIRVPGVLMQIRANIVFERPKRLRLRGYASSLTGQEIDFGSNDTLFWLWVRRLESKEMYYCRHDQFATCPMRQAVPIEPDWILEALGIVEFRADEQHEGPYPVGDGNYQIVTRRQTPSGQFTKKTTFNDKGWIVRQEMFSPQNVLTALAISSDHRYDKLTGVLYAQKVEVQCQGAEGSLSIDLGNPTFNSPTPISSGLFTMPSFDGYRSVDICGPEVLQRGGAPVTPTIPYQTPTTPQTYPATPPLNTTPQPVSGAPTPLVYQPWPTAQPSYDYVPSTAGNEVQTVVR